MKLFRCFYCGLDKPNAERSDEHIIQSCIGGNRNVTLTNDVCGECNRFMGEHVDRPFCRDWFIESARLLARIVHRGKRPTLFMGFLRWSRPERAGGYVLENGAWIWVVEGADGERRLLVGLDEANAAMVERVRKVIKTKFAGLRVINDASLTTAYDDELVQAFLATSPPWPLRMTVRVTAWHRALVKIALGLACQSLGAAFVQSPDADLLRSFLREHDAEKRAAIPVHGCVGLGPETTPVLTRAWHPGGEEHLFALLTASSGETALVANLFGRFENVVGVSGDPVLAALLPGTASRGVCWVVDPERKTTQGPFVLDDFLRTHVGSKA